MSDNQSLNNLEEQEINLREELDKYLRYWPWFILGVLASIILAFVYLNLSPREDSLVSETSSLVLIFFSTLLIEVSSLELSLGSKSLSTDLFSKTDFFSTEISLSSFLLRPF